MLPVASREFLSYAERIGGRWAIAPQRWVITLCLMPLLAAAYTKNLGSTHIVVWWSCFAFLGLCVVGAVDVVLDRTLFRNRREVSVPAWWVMGDSAFGGLVIGCSAWMGAWRGGASDLSQMALRIPSLTLIAALWGVFLTLLLDYRERASESRTIYIDEMVQLELAKVQQSAIVTDAIQAVREETEREIERIREVLTGLSIDEASAVLRTSASEAIQPMSRRLWESARNSYPTLRMRDVLSHSVRMQSFQPWSLAMLTIALSVVDRMDRIGEVRGFVVTLLIAAGVVIQLTFVNRLIAKWSSLHRGLFLGAVVVIELQTCAVVVWERRIMSLPVSYAEIFVSILASLFLIFLSVGVRSFDLLSGQVARFATMGVEAERISSIARDRHIGAALRDIARNLHGTVQTRLVSCAMALDMAAQASDGESANAALLEARRVLAEASATPLASERSIEDEVDRKVAVWDGLCACSVLIDIGTDDPRIAEMVGQVVEEGITNAIRHGQASKVDVIVSQDSSGRYSVTVRDNGTGPGGGKRGVGSAIIDLATHGDWVLTTNGNGSTLEAHIRI